MDIKINTESVLTFKALTMSKAIFDQIEKLTNCKDLAYIGYSVDSHTAGSIWFISQYQGKLYRTRQDYMMENFIAMGKKDINYSNFNQAIEQFKKGLPQIFVK
jgi:hypothetical protein